MVDDCSGAATTVSQQFGECLEVGAGVWAIVTNGEATEENANHVKTTFVVALAALAGAYI